MENLELLVRELCKYKDELPWLEFKHKAMSQQTVDK